MRRRRKGSKIIGLLILLGGICAGLLAEPALQDSLRAGEETGAQISDVQSMENSGGELPGGQLEVHFIDVGQGDAVLIKSADASMLVDAGDDSKGTAIQNYLLKQGIERLNYLVLTHPDSDHIGGAPVIIEKFEIDQVFLSDFEKDNSTYRKLVQALDNKGLVGSTPSVGQVFSLGDAQVTILGPCDTYSDPNNASLALLVQNGEDSFLFTGAAEEEGELAMLARGL